MGASENLEPFRLRSGAFGAAFLFLARVCLVLLPKSNVRQRPQEDDANDAREDLPSSAHEW